MAQTLYYPGRSTYWDTVSQRRALGQPYSPELIRAGLEGERLGELSAYYAAADRQRGRDLEQERINVSREQMTSAERIADENRQAQEKAAMVGTVGQLAVAAPMMYGAGKMAGWWGGPSATSIADASRASAYPSVSTAPSVYPSGAGSWTATQAVPQQFSLDISPLEFGSEEAYAAYLQGGANPAVQGWSMTAPGQQALTSAEMMYDPMISGQNALAYNPSWASYLSYSNPYMWPAYAYLGGDMMERMLKESTFGQRTGQTVKDIVAWPFRMATNPGSTWEDTKKFGGDIWEGAKEAPSNVGREVSRVAEQAWDFATGW